MHFFIFACVELSPTLFVPTMSGFTRGSSWIWDAHLSLQFNSMAKREDGICSCITATSVPILRCGDDPSSSRSIFGVECLALQGLAPSECPGHAGFANKELIDLAGNAFSGACVVVASMIMVTVFSSILPASMADVTVRQQFCPSTSSSDADGAGDAGGGDDFADELAQALGVCVSEHDSDSDDSDSD